MFDARYGSNDERPPMETPVILVMPNGAWFIGRRIYVEDDDGSSWAWATDIEGESNAPPCWTDGVCWAVNEDGKPSEQPRFWRHKE